MSNNTKDHTPPCGNPYEILSVPTAATTSQIKKAFRDLSLRLHPDKRHLRRSTPPQTDEELDRHFIRVKDARSFLLDDEHSVQKKKYDAQLAGVRRRKEMDGAREAEMDGNRRRMRDDLERKLRKEEAAVGGGSGSGSGVDLNAEGKRMRETFDERRADDERRRSDLRRKKRTEEVERRQIRLKWSRKKVGLSRAGIAELFSGRFGGVVEVEPIGKKGNAALVTFEGEGSCRPCVEAYRTSEEMRASYVGKRKEEEEEEDDGVEAGGSSSSWRDRESVEERKLRQAAEREVLLRRMENEEEGEEGVRIGTDRGKTTSGRRKETVATRTSFPPKFPPRGDGGEGKVTALQRLEELEQPLLKDLLSPAVLRGIRITSL